VIPVDGTSLEETPADPPMATWVQTIDGVCHRPGQLNASELCGEGDTEP
jgi:hypothetical protein